VPKLALASVVCLLYATPVLAHRVSLSSLKIEFNGRTAHTEWTISARDLHHVGRPVDADRNGRITVNDLVVQGPAIQAFFERYVKVRVDNGPCEYEPGGVSAGKRGQLVVRGSFRCDHAPGRLDMDCAFHQAVAGGHRMITALTFSGKKGGSGRWHTFGPGSTTWTIEVGSHLGRLTSQVARFLALGVEHIFTGYDHLAFLLGLLLLGGGLRRIAMVVTAFTVAHSITLALAALGQLSLPPSVVEPAIAASIAYVGIENFFIGDGRRRWVLAFVFGLIHGFGFAGVLREMGLPRDALAVSLVCFNLGVETGQLVIVAFLLGAAALIRKSLRGGRLDVALWYRPWGLRALSAPIVAAGLYWFLERTIFA